MCIRDRIKGVATLKDTKKKREIIVTDNESGESKTYLIPYGSRIKVQDGDYLEAGDELTEGDVYKRQTSRCFPAWQWISEAMWT